MTIEEKLIQRMSSLADEADFLEVGDPQSEICRNDKHRRDCIGWLTAVDHVVRLACAEGTAYRTAFDRELKSAALDQSFFINQRVGLVRQILLRLLEDARAGLLASLADVARAEVFDDFLDHAKQYHRGSKKNEAGTIAGVVFEDTIRRLCDKHGILQKDVPLDRLISELASRGLLTSTKAKRARTAAHVRTKATHAQWEEFELGDVDETIRVTTELVELLEA